MNLPMSWFPRGIFYKMVKSRPRKILGKDRMRIVDPDQGAGDNSVFGFWTYLMVLGEPSGAEDGI